MLPRLTRFEVWLGVSAFAAFLAVGLAVLFAGSIGDALAAQRPGAVAWPIAILCVLALFLRKVFGRAAWHALANRIGVSDHAILKQPWVIDGDTIADNATGKRYRLANIDAPETGDNAKCFREQAQGEAAKWFAIRTVRTSKAVTVRNTFRTDRFGRRIAFVYVDGQDLGQKLVEEGFAVPWRGRRKRWCGGGGQLREMAAVRGEAFSCTTCANWR
jgi:endonuclease YncB( thermonuclease family)